MYKLNKQAFGDFLAKSRKEKGYTQKDLAEKLFVSDKAVSKWERGLSVPDVSLLVPLAELLDVTVTELLEGRRIDRKEFAPSEVESIVQKAITYPEEREGVTQRIYQRVQKCLLLFVLCAAFGLATSVLGWKMGAFESASIKACWITFELLGVSIGAYSMFLIDERLPHYYDENRINTVSQYGFRISIPGVYFNNNNWSRVLKAVRIWSAAAMAATPVLCALVSWLSVRFEIEWLWQVLLLVFLTTMFLAIIYVARKYEMEPPQERS